MPRNKRNGAMVPWCHGAMERLVEVLRGTEDAHETSCCTFSNTTFSVGLYEHEDMTDAQVHNGLKGMKTGRASGIDVWRRGEQWER